MSLEFSVDVFSLSEIDLTSAASSGNYILIKNWIEKVWNSSRQDSNGSQDDLLNLGRSKQCPTPVMANMVGKMIRAAALDGEVAIVDFLRSYAYLNESAEEMNNWTVLHCAVMGITRYNHAMQSARDRFITNLSPAQENQLQIIYLLYEVGANVTMESSPSVTPFVLALELCSTVNFWVGAVLLEKLQKIQRKGVPSRVKEIPGPIYEECIQTLVQWATVRQYTELALQILRDPDFNHELMEKCLKLNKSAYTLFHVVADNGSGEFMHQLISVSHIRPEVVANCRYTCVLPENSAVKEENKEMSQTPLSLAIGKNHLGIINAIHRSNEALTYINLSNVSIRTVPQEIFLFSSLKVLDLSKNKLNDLPLHNDFVDEIKVVEIDLSSNRFRFIPYLLFSLPMLESLNMFVNEIETVPANCWKAAKLQRLDLSNNSIKTIGVEPICTVDLLSDTDAITPPSIHRPAASHIDFRLRQRTTLHSDTVATDSTSDQSSLTVLRLNNNRLKLFPRGLACLAPKLESLYLVNNYITNLCSIEELPSKLRNLDVSCNFIDSSSTIFQLANSPLPCFRASNQSPSFCSHMSHRSLSNLSNLNCSHNELKEISLTDKEQNLFFPKLFSLNLSYNQFIQLPMELYRFTELKLLTISNNPNVTQIPRDIGYINSLIEFEYNNVADPLVGTLNGIPSIPEKLTYLRSMKQSSEKNSMIKLMIVGPSGHGKSTLLLHLKSKSKVISQPVTFFDRYSSYCASSSVPAISQSYCALAKERNSTVGIDIGEFINDGGSITSHKVTFIAWDFAGQEEYFITHHCFIVPGAIYAVCCRTKDLFESGVSILLPWLAMIKAKAPGSPVLIVGTFCDQLPSKTLKRCDELKKYIMAQFSAPNASVLVEIKDVVFVECTSRRKPCINQLKNKLYELAFTVTIPPTGPCLKYNPQKLLHQLVPLAYMEFQQKILAQAAHIRRHLNEQQPVVTWVELQQLASGIISDEKELCCAIDHMKRNGTLIHFDAEGLQQFYFIDPQWLIDKLSLVVSTPNISILSDFTGQQHPEIVNTRSLMKCLSNNLSSPTFQDAFCKLLFRFELAIPIDESRLFFPSLLLTHSQFHYFKLCYSFPRNVDLEVLMSELIVRDTYFGGHIDVKQNLSAPRNVTLQPTGLCYRRFFILTVVPVPLWPRLISWCITGSKFLKIIKKNCLNTLPFEPLQDLGKTRIGNSILEWIYWKNGIELRLSGMTLLQISSVDLTGCNKEAEGINLHTYVKEIYINNGNQWLQLPLAYTGGLEVTVPESVLYSVGDSPDQYKVSSILSAQIFTHCIEIVDEVFMEWFTTANTGSNMHAISKYLISFTPCPICVGDEDKRTYVDNASSDLIHSMHENSMQLLTTSFATGVSTCFTGHGGGKKSKKSIFDYNQPEVIAQVNKFGFRYVDSSDTIGDNTVGFTTMHCLWIAQYQDFVHCPRHGTLKLQHLVPDLVYTDAKDFIISKKRLMAAQSEQTIRQGGFGKVVKKKLMNEHDQSIFTIVAAKVLGRCDVHNPENVLQQYCDIRRELNMIYGLEHPRIVKFHGMTVHPVGFVMEWAGMGSLDDIIKQHQSQRQYICPDSVFAVTLQVISGLQYLHKDHIVHFDIKPQNILIFNFPRESHCCYSQNDTREVVSLRCIHCSKTGELDGVVTKLADLGISVRKGPRGFVRKIASPGHTAPEALLHRGLEQLSEKVDMFSLGMCMYETMACTLVPPKEYSIFEFDEELKNGIRPGFLENDPRYPALLYDCMTSCWDQDPHVRPSATKLLEALSFTKLQLIDFFVFNDYKITDVQCCCKVFNEESKKEQLWLAVNEQSGGSSIIVIEFQVYGSKVVPQVTLPLCFTDKILNICQVQQFVYIILKGIKIVIVHSQSHEHLSTDQNPFNSTSTVTGDPCAVCCIQEMNLIFVAFTSGDIGILSLPENQFNLTALQSSFEYEIISSIGRRGTHLCSLGVESHFLCMEVVATDESPNELWCGCNNNTIIILSLQSLSVERIPVVSQTIRNVSGSPHISCKILQLKMVNTLNLQLVCVLLDGGIIVCYDAALKDCLKRIPTSTAIVMLPCNNQLYLGTRSGQILSLNINSIITDEAANEKPLVCGKHEVDQPVFDLLTVTGELSPHNFLEGFGSVHCKPNNKPCKVMLSIGGGYTEFFSCSEAAITVSPNDLCIISFRV